MSKFTIQLVERTITWADDDSEDYTDEHEAGTVEPAELREALDALEHGCWDSIDEYGDGTIIAYPADMHQDMHTGAYESTQLIVKAARPEWADRLMALYTARAAR